MLSRRKTNTAVLKVFIVVMIIIAVLIINGAAYRDCDEAGGEMVKTRAGAIECAKIVNIN